RDYPDSPLRPRADFTGARAYFDMKDDVHGCALIREALDGADADVEFKNQVTFYAPRCAMVPAGPVAGTTPTPGDSQTKPAAPASTYAVQVLAVKSASQVDEMLTRLKVMGFDAQLAARVLGLTLTSRNNGGAAEVPLAGVPVKAATDYLRRLIAQGHRVAICEQVEDPKLAKGLVRREVVETVTPGSVLADDWL